jgi:protein SCO1/2
MTKRFFSPSFLLAALVVVGLGWSAGYVADLQGPAPVNAPAADFPPQAAPAEAQNVPTATDIPAVRATNTAMPVPYWTVSIADVVRNAPLPSYTAQLQGSVMRPPRPIQNFSAPSTLGKNFQLSDFGGKILLFYFGYMTCPDVCPTTIADMLRAYREVGEPRDNVKVIFVTLDPERDTLERLSIYMNAFHKDFIGVRPESQAQVDALVANFGVTYEKREVDSTLGYLIDHSASVLVMSPNRHLVSQLPYGVSYKEIVNDIEVLMRYTLNPAGGALARSLEAPDSDPAREYRIVIPEGTASQIAMGNDPGIIPLKIELTLGVKDILVLENHDDTDYLVGGVWVAPYETVYKQFYEPQTFVGMCTITVGRDLIEIIVSEP